MPLFLEGMLFGVVPVFFVGPVLFTLLSASLEQGFAAGARVALGIALSDVVAIGICLAGLGPVLSRPWGQWLLQLAGGLILLGFGLSMILAARTADPRPRPAAPGRHFVAGFAVNFINPFVFSFWIGAIGLTSARYGTGMAVMLPFFGGVVATILLTDLLKAWAAGALQRHLSGPVLLWARRLSGLLLGGAGLVLLVRALLGGLP